jgi:putative hydrolase of the HAD superfamily
MDVGRAKPRPEPFAAALRALGSRPGETIHIGDNERTDVRGALDAGLRAIRVDFVRQGGPSAAEFVARSFEELTLYLLAQR